MNAFAPLFEASPFCLTAMECSKRFVAMGICVMLVMAFAAEVNAQCSLSALAPCYGAVQGAYPPRPNGGRNGACCRAVMVANPACLCSQMQQGRYPQNMIRNAFAMPRVCGRTNLRGYKCGSKCLYSCPSVQASLRVSWRTVCDYSSVLEMLFVRTNQVNFPLCIVTSSYSNV